MIFYGRERGNLSRLFLFLERLGGGGRVWGKEDLGALPQTPPPFEKGGRKL